MAAFLGIPTDRMRIVGIKINPSPVLRMLTASE